MSAQQRLTSHAIETFEDELDSHIEESLKDPDYHAASVDIDRRLRLIRSLVALRKHRGLTQKQLAAEMGVAQSTVAGFETEGSDPRLSTVQRYARSVGAECFVMVQVVPQDNWTSWRPTYSEATVPTGNVTVSTGEAKWPLRADFAWAA